MRKKSLAFLVGLALLPLTNAVAQGPDCRETKPICGNAEVTYRPMGRGEDDFAKRGNIAGCFSGKEHNSGWYIIKIAESGNLIFSLVPDDPKSDYDFGIWGPNVDCDNLGAPVRCNTSAPPGETGLSMSGSDVSQGPGKGSPVVKYLEVKKGETYYLLIDNASSNGDAFKLTWGGTARLGEVVTGNFEAGSKCNTLSLVAKVSSCSSGSFSFEWKVFDSNNKQVARLTNAAANVFFELPFGDYTVHMTATSAGGGELTTTQQAKVSESATVGIQTRVTCSKVEAGATVQSCNPATAFRYDWTVKNQAGTVVNDLKNGGQRPDFDLRPGKYTLQVTVTSPAGTATSPGVPVEITASDVDIPREVKACFEDNGNVAVTAEVINKIKDADYSFEWRDPAGMLLCKEPMCVLQQPGMHSVTMAYSGCLISRTFLVREYCPAVINVPTAFSPNGDGLNDVLHITGKRYMRLNVQIFNRWGELVFAGYAPGESDAIGWDGTHQGKRIAEGVYAVMISYFDTGNPGRPLSRRETLTVVK